MRKKSAFFFLEKMRNFKFSKLDIHHNEKKVIFLLEKKEFIMTKNEKFLQFSKIQQ